MASLRNLAITALRLPVHPSIAALQLAGHPSIAAGLRLMARHATRPLALLGIPI